MTKQYTTIVIEHDGALSEDVQRWVTALEKHSGATIRIAARAAGNAVAELSDMTSSLEKIEDAIESLDLWDAVNMVKDEG